MSIISLINKIPFGNSAQKGFYLYSKLPQGFLENLEKDNFKKTVQYVYENSKFYKRKFDEAGIRPEKVKTPEDLGNFFTTPEDIRANVHEFVCMPADTAYETTGTTSKKTKRVYFSRNEVKEAGWSGAVGLWGLGVRPEDRVASAFDYSFWVSGPVLQAACEVLGCFHVEAGRIDAEEFYERLSDYGITVIVGDPSWIVRLSQVAKEKGAWPLKLIIGGGENLTEQSRKYIEDIWKTDLILSYGQTEAFGSIGIESRDKEGYHLNEFHNFFEIINPDKEGYGELVYTNLNRRVMPLIRYRSGDITRFLEGKTKSGMPGRRIAKLKGRVDEWMATSMGNIAPWMFEEVLKDVKGLGNDWQVVVQKDGNLDQVILNVETTGEISDMAPLREDVLLALRKHMPDAYKIMEIGCAKLEVKAHPKNSLRTDRKLKRILDLRKF